MKRSEMLRIIFNVLTGIGSDGDITGYDEKVLKSIEEAGMLPPLFNWNEGLGKYSLMVNEWEPED